MMGIGAQIAGFIKAACSAEDLREANIVLREENDHMRAENEAFRQENARLQEAVEKLKRRSKRQAFPFSRDKRKTEPQKARSEKGRGIWRTGKPPHPRSHRPRT